MPQASPDDIGLFVHDNDSSSAQTCLYTDQVIKVHQHCLTHAAGGINRTLLVCLYWCLIIDRENSYNVTKCSGLVYEFLYCE